MSNFGPSAWMKKATPFGYARISTSKQDADDRRVKGARNKPILKRQMAEVNAALKAKGLPAIKPENWFVEVGSGTNPSRPEWLELQAKALNHKGRAFIAVKDPSRWARDADGAVEAWAPLKRRGIPILAASEGIQTGNATDDIRPQESFFFLLQAGFAASVSDTQKKKARAAVERQRSEGVLAGKGQSLYPFAPEDPLLVMDRSRRILDLPGGGAKFARAVSELTQPKGPSEPAIRRLLKRDEAARAKLSAEDYASLRDFRTGIRDILRERGHDPFAKFDKDAGPTDWGARALMRNVGAYLKEPDQFQQPTPERVAEILANPVEFLSDKDKKRKAKKGF